LAQRINIIGVNTHNVTMIVSIHILDWKSLHPGKHFAAEFLQSPLGNNRHHLVVCNTAKDRQRVNYFFDCQV